MKFVRNSKLPIRHRVMWLCFVLMALICLFFGGIEIWFTYSERKTATTISTTMYQYAKTPFPSVTICQSNRIDWNRINELNLSFYNSDIQTDIKHLLEHLSTLSFGQLEVLEETKLFRHFEILIQLNIDNLLSNSLRQCSDMFHDLCWWRTNFVNCCEIFEIQKSIYGYCYAFNSDVSEQSKETSLDYGLKDGLEYWFDNNGIPRPRRSAGHGPWSGLRATIELPNITNGIQMSKRGVYIIITDPSNHPFEPGLFIPINTLGNIAIWGDAISTSYRISQLLKSQRKCLFSSDMKTLSRGYLRENCNVECIQKAMIQYCQCIPYFMFFILKEAPYIAACNLNGLLCIAEHFDDFNNFLPNVDSIGLDKTDVGIYCDCPDNCKSQSYISKLVISKDAQAPNQLVLDIHYEKSDCILYQTDIVFGFLDALVAYGGVAGLFIGASIMSIVEILYEILIQLINITKIFILKSQKKRN